MAFAVSILSEGLGFGLSLHGEFQACLICDIQALEALEESPSLCEERTLKSAAVWHQLHSRMILRIRESQVLLIDLQIVLISYRYDYDKKFYNILHYNLKWD